MDCESQFEIWIQQVEKLKASMTSLSQTEPKNVLQHFFLQASESELRHELETTKVMTKQIICKAIENAHIAGNKKQRVAQIIRFFINEPILQYISLADIRNIIVFEIFKQCNITVDTYFERYSSPPGSADQNEQYNRIAHGSAKASASKTKVLTALLLYIQVLKRFFIVHDIVHDRDTNRNSSNLNWLGAMWAAHVRQKGMSDLIWELYLDLWYYENNFL